MFTREKVRVNPVRNKTKKSYKGNTSKAAWETLLASSKNHASKGEGSSRAWRGSEMTNGFAHIQWSDDDDDDDAKDNDDKFKTPITPSASFIFSESHTKSFENLWRSAAAEARVNSSLEFHMHPGQPPVPKQIVGQICEGKYINFQELLLENLGKEDAKNKILIDETQRVDDITKWIDCMAIYISVYTSHYPNRIRDLLAYQGIITRLYRDCQDKKAWQRYDVAFRRKAFQTSLRDWSTVDENLWIMSSSRDARRAVLCKACLSLTHNQASCPLLPKAESAKTPRLHSWLSRSSKLLKKDVLGEEEQPQSVSTSRHTQSPNEGLDLKFAFGYHGYNACNNLFYTQSKEVVFHVAALGIVYSSSSNQQRFYKGHTDDIICLTIHDDKDFVATGQVGKQAETHVWDATTMKTVAVLKGFHKRGIICVDFSGDGKKLADVGLDDDHSICIWDWKKEEKLASTRGHKDIIFVIEWNPFNPNYLVSVGEKHIKFWTQKNSKLEKRPVTFGKAGAAATMLCVCHSPNDDLCFSGSDSGLVYIWQGTTLRRSVQAHNGPVCAMFSLSQTKHQGYVTGGRDGVVAMWDPMFEQCLKAFKVEEASMRPGSILLQNLPPVRALHFNGDGRILLGTGNDEIIEIEEDEKMTVLVQGHGEGEVWGLDTHPTQYECITVSDDRTLRVWDLAKFKLKKVKKLKKGGRAVAYSPDGLTVAVGQNDGGLLILDAVSLEKVVGFKDRKEAISDIKFSPDGKFLAVGSHDNFVDIYSVRRGKRTGVCKGSSSYITHLDWDSKGKLIQTNSGAREHLFYQAPTGSRKTISSPDVERLQWSTFTGVLGPTVKGVFPPGSDVTDVNATCRTKDCSFLASGDDFGFVNLFEYPIWHRGAKGRQYRGHSSHVTNVRWTYDDRMLLSTGGLDTAVLIWDRLVVSEVDEPDKLLEQKVLIQPKFIPTGPIRDPVARGKPQWD
ncbi:echinoderm microtubule-associated protein-like 6 [Montipora capricornis]|uniref:echinoderm microtubule-associated protein-like 6 n=1 Tax=Montipora capricornis TaxID=246305 RepID=UPI0035F11849